MDCFVGLVEGDEDGYQFRSRRVVSNASADGTECPALGQMRRCRSAFGDACTRWEVQPLLDACHLAGNATCGRGYRELVFRCRRYDGVSVALFFLFSLSISSQCHYTRSLSRYTTGLPRRRLFACNSPGCCQTDAPPCHLADIQLPEGPSCPLSNKQPPHDNSRPFEGL